MPRTPPLIGRDVEHAELTRALRAGRSVLVSGPAGIGKTRLVRDALAELDGTRTVEHVLAAPATATHRLGTLAPLGLVGADDDLGPAIAGVLRSWTSRPGLVLWIDDAQHVDPTTATTVRHAAVHGDVQVVATHRTAEALPADLEALVTESVLDRAVLGPLAHRSAERLVRHWVGNAQVAESTVHDVVTLAAGNPLYLRELTRAALDGLVDLHAAPALDVLVGRACRTLPPDRRDVLELVAAAEPAPSVLLARWRSTIEVLVAQGLVERHGGTVRVDHPLRRTWLLHDLADRQADVYGRLVDALAEHPDTEVAPRQVVTWHDLAHRPADPALLGRTARRAVGHGDVATARDVADRLDGELHALVEAQVLALEGRLDEALPRLDHLALTGSEEHLTAAHWSVRLHGIVRGDLDRARAVVAGLERRRDPASETTVLRARLWLWNYRPLPADVDLDAFAAAVVALPEHGAEHAELKAGATAFVANTCGAAAATALVPTMLRTTDRLPPADPAAMHAENTRAWLRAYQCDGRHARRLSRRAVEQGLASHDVDVISSVCGAAGLMITLTGRPAEGALVSGQEVASVGAGTFRVSELQTASHAGNVVHAEGPAAGRALVESLPRTDDPGPDPLELLTWRAWTLVEEAEGRPPDVGRTLQVLDRALRSRRFGYLALMTPECVTDRMPDVAHARLAEGLPADGEGLVRLARTAASARVRGDGDELRQVGLRLEEARLGTLALRVLGDVCGRPDGGRGAARAAVLRLLRRWDGPDPWWLPDLPTPRQREVAWAVARGEPTEGIARRLTLSRRTVENHLQRVYEHLHVHGRDALTEALTSTGR